jgi:predicted ATPase
MMFSALTLTNWRQFSRVELEFHPRLTVLTGANGSGKTTILHLLNRHWGWNLQYVSTPRWDRSGVRRYWAGFWSEDEATNESIRTNDPVSTTRLTHRPIGTLSYSTGESAEIRVPEEVSESFNVELKNQVNLPGVYVPSHRPPYLYQRVEQIATQVDAKQQIFDTFVSEMKARFHVGQKTQSPAFRIKSALISLATFGYGNEAVDRNEDAVQLFEGFENILRIVLPESLRFRRIRVRVPDVLLETETEPFSFDAVSGGVAAIIDLAWQIFMYAQLHESFVIVIDEPETHLHPQLQQRLLPDLLQAFPKCQFVVATHNPLMVTSVSDSNIYVFNYNASGRVESEMLDTINKAASADETLREVLGLPYTVPQWANREIDTILDEFSARAISEQTVHELRSKMAALGLDRFFPATLANVVKRRQ